MEPARSYVFLAGIGNSEPEHWQAIWYGRVGNGAWVEHASWDNAVRDEWVKDLDEALAALAGPKLLIAHSLGCSVVTEWASEHEDPSIEGAFLVAPPDVHGSHFPAEAVGFDAPSYARLPFRTVVVASEDDPYGSLEHAADIGGRLGARVVNVGRKGHINGESGLGEWDEGWSVFCEELGVVGDPGRWR